MVTNFRYLFLLSESTSAYMRGRGAVPGLWGRGGGVHLHPLQLHLLLVLHSSKHSLNGTGSGDRILIC